MLGDLIISAVTAVLCGVWVPGAFWPSFICCFCALLLTGETRHTHRERQHKPPEQRSKLRWWTH